MSSAEYRDIQNGGYVEEWLALERMQGSRQAPIRLDEAASAVWH